MKRALLREPIYGTWVLFLNGGIAKNAEKVGREWLSKCRCNMEGRDFTAFDDDRGVTFKAGAYYVLWVRDVGDFRTIVHEAIHVGTSVMSHIGHNITEDGDEPLAYYVDWLVSEAMKRR